MAIVREFRTEELPVAERFGSWLDMANSALIPNKLRSEHEDDFRAGLRLLDLGEVQVSVLRYPPLETHRTPRLIRQSDPESYQLYLNLRGGHRIVQDGRDTAIGPGELLLYSTSRPWKGWAGGDPDAVEGVMMQFSRAMLPMPAPQVDPLTAQRLSASDGIGALVSGYLTQLAAGAAGYQAADAARLAVIGVDLVAALLAHHLDGGTQLPPDSHLRVLKARICAFIERQLGDPGLSPAVVAAAHQISLRYLQRLFHDQGMTVSNRIRERRLERCRRDLANPQLGSRPIHAIATRWGFTSAAHFSRAFRAAYGMPPGDYRQLMQQDWDLQARPVNTSARTVNDLPTVPRKNQCRTDHQVFQPERGHA
ncbi:helix-turn-helix domain-containing protein [Streptomyces sp. NPDC001231]|uniref:AraC-like ligand-binding domain-containing protein n=1 Tax=Streptomyces sp. NPDC001231 TaxID=3364549 RepID=UPI0036BA76C1